ncbi:MAG TPA: DNA gyrase C-terminal beta-propeller domain-containing protein, partial [Gammaproteobacteria bacterium]|nr:DNA gyrase C-terminal beta-propeller domain-containing protein [Gammaproteobacteria bacterium]
GGRLSKGRPIINMLPLHADEKISAILPVREYAEDTAIFMATTNGTVKQVAVTEFSKPRASGIIAIDLEEGDHLIGAGLTTNKDEVLLVADSGKAIRFKCEEVRCMGRVAKGVRGIKLQPAQKVIALIVLQPDGAILLATKNGFGKRTATDEFPTIGRGGQGVIGIVTSERNGEAIGAAQVFEGDELMLISDQGTLVRTRVDEISLVGRNTQGVRLISLGTDEHLVGIERVEEIAGVEGILEDTSEEE